MPAVVLVTASNRAEADVLANRLLEEKLAACVNILPVNSHYWWRGKIEREDELLLLVKTQRSLVKEIVKVVKAHHSYEVPEVIALPVTEGNNDYLRWITDSVKSGRKGKRG